MVLQAHLPVLVVMHWQNLFLLYTANNKSLFEDIDGVVQQDEEDYDEESTISINTAKQNSTNLVIHFRWNFFKSHYTSIRKAVQ